MRAFGAVRGLVLAGTLALAVAACSSGNGDGPAKAQPRLEATTRRQPVAAPPQAGSRD